MSLNLEKIESVISNMDETYDANFGDWIRNEENCKIIAYHLKKYVHLYPTHDFVVVLKWVVKDWTLRSIIILSKMMLISDIESEFETRIDILQGLIHTWHPAFVAEFIISTCKILDESIKTTYIRNIIENFNTDRVQNILKEIGDKMGSDFKESILCEHTTNSQKPKKQKKKQNPLIRK